jgi:hypothetical protein
VQARFPDGTPRVNAATRAMQLVRRKQAIDRRFGLTGR